MGIETDFGGVQGKCLQGVVVGCKSSQRGESSEGSFLSEDMELGLLMNPLILSPAYLMLQLYFINVVRAAGLSHQAFSHVQISMALNIKRFLFQGYYDNTLRAFHLL